MSKITQMWKEQNGVSPVIGVVLLVAITVILAAVVGVLAFGLDNNQNASPSVAMESSAQGQTVEFTVSSGDNFDPSTATLKIDVTVKNPKSGNSKTTSLSSPLDNDTSKSLTITDASGNDENVDVEFASLDSDDVTAGDSFSVNLASSKSNSNLAIVNYNAKVVRQSDGGSSSSVLFSDKGSASASSGGGSSGSSSSSSSPLDFSLQSVDSSNPSGSDWTITYEVDADNASNPSNYYVSTTIIVNGSTEGITATSMDTGYSASNSYTTEYDTTISGSTFDAGDTFTLKVSGLSSSDSITSYTIEIREGGPGGTAIYYDQQTPPY